LGLFRWSNKQNARRPGSTFGKDFLETGPNHPPETRVLRRELFDTQENQLLVERRLISKLPFEYAA
jgi:hypothetical protein